MAVKRMSSMIRQPLLLKGPVSTTAELAKTWGEQRGEVLKYNLDAFSLRDAVAALIEGWTVPKIDDSVWAGLGEIYRQMPEEFKEVCPFALFCWARGYR